MDLTAAPETGEVVASSSEDSRRTAHQPIADQAARLERERQQLIKEKAGLEDQLRTLEGRRKIAISESLRKRLNKSEAIAATARIEANISQAKSPFINRCKDIDARLFELKRLRSRATEWSNEHREQKRRESQDVQLWRDEMLAQTVVLLGEIRDMLSASRPNT